ncbi:MAG: tetratricopeptide repeat protein [Bdellovibrionales bacterium]|nr:tetratricopeptide repeat protein [Bdellovibrionales bacterium]
MVQLLLSFFSCLAFAQTAALMEAELNKKPDSVRLRQEVATLYFSEGKPDKVIELLNAYTDRIDDSGFLLLASAYGSKTDHYNEVRVLKILTARKAENVKYRMILGQAYIKQANKNPNSDVYRDLITSGVQELRLGLKINPKFKPAYDLLLNTLLQHKNNNEAREVLIEGINLFGARPELYRELCRLDSNDGFIEDAVKHCRESIRLSPNFPDHYVYLTQSLFDKDEDQQAERTIVNAAKRFPRSEFVQWAAGKLFLQKKNFPVAARYFKTAVKADPKQSRSQFGAAQALYESGAEAESLEYFISACKSDHKSLDTFFAAGARLKQKGDNTLGAKFTQAANTCR